MNSGRFANVLGMMLRKIAGTLPQTSGASPAPPPAGSYILFEESATEYTFSGEDSGTVQMIYQE